MKSATAPKVGCGEAVKVSSVVKGPQRLKPPASPDFL